MVAYVSLLVHSTNNKRIYSSMSEDIKPTLVIRIINKSSKSADSVVYAAFQNLFV